jgi:hypothetical protein
VKLQEMHRYRKISDYDDAEIVTQIAARRALQDAKFIFDNLS